MDRDRACLEWVRYFPPPPLPSSPLPDCSWYSSLSSHSLRCCSDRKTTKEITYNQRTKKSLSVWDSWWEREREGESTWPGEIGKYQETFHPQWILPFQHQIPSLQHKLPWRLPLKEINWLCPSPSPSPPLPLPLSHSLCSCSSSIRRSINLHWRNGRAEQFVTASLNNNYIFLKMGERSTY